MIEGFREGIRRSRIGSHFYIKSRFGLYIDLIIESSMKSLYLLFIQARSRMHVLVTRFFLNPELI
jgi:hypothetical protein